MQTKSTPRAASAIITQMTAMAEEETTRYATIDGVEHEFTVYYTTEWGSEERYSDTHSSGYGSADVAECTIIGAWTEDEDGDVAFAGDRRELETLIGDKLVSEWEYDLAESAME